MLQIISIQIPILFLFFPLQLWHFARAASGLLRNIQLEICAQDFLYFTLLESPSLCVYMCRSFTRIRGLCNVHKGAHSCVHFPPFLLSAIAFRTAHLKATGSAWERGGSSKLLGHQQVAMTIEYPGNQNHMKSLPLTVCKNFECASKQLIIHISIEFY